MILFYLFDPHDCFGFANEREEEQEERKNERGGERKEGREERGERKKERGKETRVHSFSLPDRSSYQHRHVHAPLYYVTKRTK